VLKAKRFQPLSVLNQKLRGLDVFESNESAPPIVASASTTSKLPEAFFDPDDHVTRNHWQKASGNDSCTDPTCGKRLGPINGSVNCRKCGRLFCEIHTMYQMKLSNMANHDPARGFWLRVCETCYKSREGYNDHQGVSLDKTSAFMVIRSQRTERQNLEISRLEKRLTRLTQVLAESAEETNTLTIGGGLLRPVASLTAQKNHRKTLEQSVVAWEEDATVSKCPFCKQEFGSWSFRRHHCRICGRVVCSDPQTGCSSEIGLTVARHKENALPSADSFRASGTSTGNTAASEKPASRTSGPEASQLSLDVRLCRDCKSTIFSKRDFENSISSKPADQRAYEALRQFEAGIRLLLPSFQRALQILQPDSTGKSPPTHAQIQDAAKIRKRLMDSFTKYNLAAKRIKELKTDSPDQQRLQKAVYAAASTFLHANMVPLKHVPRMLRSQSDGPSLGHRKVLSSLNGGGRHPSPLRNGALAPDAETGSVAGSEASTIASALEAEEKELRERLVVLEEQRFLVHDMVSNARGARRTEEVGALSRNLQELDKEIEMLRKRVGGVEERWEELYANEVEQ
jgi:rabenosyn-5